jgi:hypothetical protein
MPGIAGLILFQTAGLALKQDGLGGEEVCGMGEGGHKQ